MSDEKSEGSELPVLEINFENGRSIDNPEERVREYCSVEIYEGYDNRHNINNKITLEDIKAADRIYALIRLYGRGLPERIVRSSEIPSALRNIENQDLGEIPDSEWQKTKKRLKKLLNSFLKIKGAGLAKATKVLHLKRPKLIPILDSFVMDFLMDVDTTQVSKSKSLQYGIKAIELARKDLRKNTAEFKKLQEELLDLPIPLTKVRLYDILCWTIEKWDIRKNLEAPHGKPTKSVKSKEIIGPKGEIKRPEGSAEMGFVVYVDGPEDYAKVHRESCGHYQKRKGDEMDTGYWKSGFETREDALNFAQNTEKSDVDTCGKCLK